MDILSFRGLLIVAGLGAAALHFQPWDHARPASAGAVVGKAIDSDGQGVAGASVVLRDAKGVVVGRAESMWNGDFKFESCKPGRYSVAAVKLGIGGGERNVLVDPRASADATIPLLGFSTVAGHR